jgi:hypothetical protein
MYSQRYTDNFGLYTSLPILSDMSNDIFHPAEMFKNMTFEQLDRAIGQQLDPLQIPI